MACQELTKHRERDAETVRPNLTSSLPVHFEWAKKKYWQTTTNLADIYVSTQIKIGWVNINGVATISCFGNGECVCVCILRISGGGQFTVNEQNYDCTLIKPVEMEKRPDLYIGGICVTILKIMWALGYPKRWRLSAHVKSKRYEFIILQFGCKMEMECVNATAAARVWERFRKEILTMIAQIVELKRASFTLINSNYVP